MHKLMVIAMVACWVALLGHGVGAQWVVVAHAVDNLYGSGHPDFLGEAIYTVHMGSFPPSVYGPFFVGQLDYDSGTAMDVTWLPNGKQALLSVFRSTFPPGTPDPRPQGGRVWLIDLQDPTQPALLGQIFLEQDLDGDGEADVSMFAEDIAVAPCGTFAIVANGGFCPTIAFIDLRSFTLTSLFHLYEGDPPAPGTPEDDLPLLGHAQSVAITPDSRTVLMADYFRGAVWYGAVNAWRDGLVSVQKLMLCPNWQPGDPDALPPIPPGCGPGEFLPRPVNLEISPDGQTAVVNIANAGMVNILRITGPGRVEPGTPFQLWGLGDTYETYLANPLGNLADFALPPWPNAGSQSTAFSPDGRRAYLFQNNSVGRWSWENGQHWPQHQPDQLSWVDITGPGQAEVGGVFAAELYSQTTSMLFGVDTLAVTPDGAFALATNPTLSGATVTGASLVDLRTWQTSLLDMNARVTAGIAAQPAQPTIPYRFPRLLHLDGVRTEGFAFANPGGAATNLSFSAYDATGQPIGSTADRPLPTHHQTADQASGLFDLTGPAEGWVEVLAGRRGLSGLFLSQLDVPGQGLDGASVILSGTTNGVFSRVAVGGGFETELVLANPGADEVQVELTLLSDRPNVRLGAWRLPGRGMVRLNMSTLPVPLPVRYEGAVRVTATGQVIGNALVRHTAGTLSTLNLQSVRGAAQRLYAPHAVNLPGVFDTTMQLVNVGPGLAGVTVRVYRTDGTPVGPADGLPGATEVHLELEEGEWIQLTGDDLELPAGFEGWLQIDSDGAALAGSVTFGQPTGRAYESTLPLSAGGQAQNCFAHVTHGLVGEIDYFTGLVVLNPHHQPVEVAIGVYHPDGTPNGHTVQRTLAAGEKYARLLPFLEGVGQLTPQGSGYLTVTANLPLHSFVMFGNDGLDFLGAVPPTAWEGVGNRYDTDSIVGDLMLVSPGTFTQGSPVTEPCRDRAGDGSETPFQHTLTRGLAVMASEVTRRMWRDLQEVQPTLPTDPTAVQFGGELDQPVQRVTWSEAVLFANLLSLQQGLTRCYYIDAALTIPVTAGNHTFQSVFCDWTANGYRLLTEGEWEYACRAGSTGPFSIAEPNYTDLTCTQLGGNSFPVLERAAWFSSNRSDPSGLEAAKPVATRLPNAWGLYDMHGNVQEWCWDIYLVAYPASTATDYRGPASGQRRVLRGGSWSASARRCRSADRAWSTPDHRHHLQGFRLARTIAAPVSGGYLHR